jgi:C4-type Zn-finger protein
MSDEPNLEISPLSQTITSGDHTVKVEIYRLEGGSSWTLEIEDEFGNSTVWDDEFESDKLALSEAKSSILSETISSFIGPSDGKSDGEWR